VFSCPWNASVVDNCRSPTVPGPAASFVVEEATLSNLRRHTHAPWPLHPLGDDASRDSVPVVYEFHYFSFDLIIPCK
jgi:hypothetical protein